MEFPNEILDLIVRQGLNSCRTTISWSQISEAFKDVIIKNLGLIVILDGYTSLHDAQIPPEYKPLMTEENTLLVLTDHIDYEKLAHFIPKYRNMLVLVQSNRSYSDVLAGAFYRIAQECLEGTDLCIVYNTSLNFLSKLYFRELSLYQEKIKLCELHVLGNMLSDGDEMCDINTLFERTYIENLRSLYSLDVQTPAHQLVSKDLRSIKLLNVLEFSDEFSDFFSGCPNLKIIESTKYPTSTKNKDGVFRLPKCDFITLTNYVDGSHYPRIDGSHVNEKLTLVPSLRSLDPEFIGLFFPNLKCVSLKLNDVGYHQVRFRSCYFPRLKTLLCGSSVVPWSDLSAAESSLANIKVTLTSVEQLQWLASSFKNVQRLQIEAPKSQIAHFPISTIYENIQLDFPQIEIEINHLWQCYLLEKLVLSNMRHNSWLKVVLDEASLLESMMTTGIHFSDWGLRCEDDFMIFKIPYLEHFTLLGKDPVSSASVPKMIKSQEQHQHTATLIPSPKDYSNVFYDSDVSREIAYAVSPSAFRRNSLAGADSQTARRQSAIVFSERPTARRKSSLGGTGTPPVIIQHPKEEEAFQGESVAFVFSERCPNILTTNISALESSLFSWNETTSRVIHFLEVQVEDVFMPNAFVTEDMGGLASSVAQKIIEVLKYPYDLRLSDMVIEKFRVLVDFPQMKINIPENDKSEILLEIQNLLSYKGYHLRVTTETCEAAHKVYVLIRF